MKRKKGISLIVLVITIIVIIILAGTLILSLANNNPISKANDAKYKTSVEAYQSELKMAISNEYLQNSSFDPNTFNKGTWNGGSITGTIKEYITSITPADAAKFVIQKGNLVYVGTVKIEKDWLIEMGIASAEAIPVGLGVNVIATSNTTVNGAAVAYNNPIIPKGFKAINDGAVWPSDWNNGLVIEDASGNQFVWVPVDGINVPYAKWNGILTDVNAVDTSDDTLPAGVTNETNQITTYGGFYIARYEAGKSSNVLVSKKASTVWANIDYANSKVKAESMYTYTEVKSGLVTGTQWDTAMKWLQNSSINVSDNSTVWGNYYDSSSPADIAGYGSLQATGFSEYWKAKNIYDLAGNTWEWTNEVYNSYRVNRGGKFDDYGCGCPAAYRGHDNPTLCVGSLSFRVVLYVL